MTDKNLVIPEKEVSAAQSAEEGPSPSSSEPSAPQAVSGKTRRQLLAGGLAAVVFGRKAYAQPGGLSADAGATSSKRKKVDASIRPGIVPGPITCPTLIGGKSAAHKLVDKATFGWTPATEADVLSTGYNAWLDQQLDPYAWPAYTNFENDLATITDPTHGYGPYPTLAGTAGSSVICDGDINVAFDIRRDLVRARVIRAIYSPAQLLERMVEFWTDHLNVYHQVPNPLNRYKTLEDTHHIRPNALGKFSELLKASALSPAMLMYLNGRENTVGTPNENYAREIMELHTLGVDNGYDHDTIIVMAQMLTGWQVTVPNGYDGGGANCGVIPPFDNNRHDNSAKTLVFPGTHTKDGITRTYNIPANLGELEIDMVIDILTDPAKMGTFTAEFIGTKMCRFFSSYNPPQHLINDVVDAYVNNWADPNTNEIAEMVRVILSQSKIHCSKEKIKRPLHLLASSARACQATISEPGRENQTQYVVGGYLQVAEHIPYEKESPDGYPDGMNDWLELRTRWELAARWAHNDFTSASISAFVGGLPTTTALDTLNALDTALFDGHMTTDDRNTILTYFGGGGTPFSLTLAREMTSLVLASPSFQCY